MKRIRLVSILVAVIMLGGLAIVIHRAREPRYQGRTLSQWIKNGESLTINTANIPMLLLEARKATRHGKPQAWP